MINETKLPAVILQLSLLLLVVTSIIGCIAWSVPVGLSILAGGSIALLNFIWQRRTLRQVLSFQITSSAAAVTVRYLLRLGLTAIALYFILTSGYFSVFGLLAGLSVIVAAIILITLYSAFHKGD